MLGRQFRIRTGKEYNNIYKLGKKMGGRYLLIYLRPSPLDVSRFGIVVSKKVGNAVRRNRVKRQIREIIRHNKDKLKGRCNIVVIARHKIFGTSYKDLEKDFLNIMKKAGL